MNNDLLGLILIEAADDIIQEIFKKIGGNNLDLCLSSRQPCDQHIINVLLIANYPDIQCMSFGFFDSGRDCYIDRSGKESHIDYAVFSPSYIADVIYPSIFRGLQHLGFSTIYANCYHYYGRDEKFKRRYSPDSQLTVI